MFQRFTVAQQSDTEALFNFQLPKTSQCGLTIPSITRVLLCINVTDIDVNMER